MGRFEEVLLFAMKVGKMPGGARKIAGIADIARHRRDRKTKTLPLINTDDTDQNKARQSTAEGGGATQALLIRSSARQDELECAMNSDQNLERNFLYVVCKSSGSTRVSPTALMKFTSPNQRGRICMWI